MLAAAALGATGGAMADAVTRKVKTFSWPVVPSGVTRQLLLAAYRVAKEDAAIDEIAGLDEERLARQAEKVFGRAGISKRHHGVATPVLRRQWLPLVPAQELVEFARMVQLGLTGEARRARLVTKSEALAFLEKRKATETFTVNLMKAFTRLNKVERIVDVPPRPPKPHVSPNGPMELEGKNEPNRMTPYEHQRLAWRKLDELANGSGRRACLLVLPTGAGKTFTMVVWLLRQLAKDPEARVLWVADQQELVEQAARVFAEPRSADADS